MWRVLTEAGEPEAGQVGVNEKLGKQHGKKREEKSKAYEDEWPSNFGTQIQFCQHREQD